MTSIQDEQKKLKDQVETYANEQDRANIAMFEEQKENMEKIATTPWFVFIRNYWLKREMEAIKKLWEIDPEKKYDIARAQASFKEATEFNKFLNVRIK